MKGDEEYNKYKEYIASEGFKAVKELVLERDNHTCRCCGWSPRDHVDTKSRTKRRCLQVHHVTYDHLYDEAEHLDTLITLCNVCHRAVHAAKSNLCRFRKKKPQDTK